MPVVSIGVFTNSLHYKNVNISNFILAVGAASLEEGGLRRWGEACEAGGHVSGGAWLDHQKETGQTNSATLKCNPITSTDIQFHIY